MGTDSQLVFLGCYTADEGGKGEGVAVARRDPRTGALSEARVAARTASPSFLARHPRRPVLYAVNELDEGTVSAWSVDRDGGLTALGVWPTGGAGPCHLAVTADGRFLLSANYGGGSAAVHRLDADGVPVERTDLVRYAGEGPDPERQEAPHAHMVVPDPQRSEVLVVDLGTDRVHRHRLDPKAGRLAPEPTELRTPPGSGPRHLVRHPDGRTVFLTAELAGALLGYQPDGQDGRPRLVAEVPASSRASDAQPSELAVRADGRFLYVANRGPDTVSVFALDEGTAPHPVAEVETGGQWPRHVAIVEGHLYVANERSHNVTVFRLDPATGVPTAAAEPLAQGSPTCVLPWAPVKSLM